LQVQKQIALETSHFNISKKKFFTNILTKTMLYGDKYPSSSLELNYVIKLNH